MPARPYRTSECKCCGNSYLIKEDGSPVKQVKGSLKPFYNSICEDYIFGMSIRQIAEKYKCSYKMVLLILEENKIPRRPRNYKNRKKIKEMLNDIVPGDYKFIRELSELVDNTGEKNEKKES